LPDVSAMEHENGKIPDREIPEGHGE